MNAIGAHENFTRVNCAILGYGSDAAVHVLQADNVLVGEYGRFVSDVVVENVQELPALEKDESIAESDKTIESVKMSKGYLDVSRTS